MGALVTYYRQGDDITALVCAITVEGGQLLKVAEARAEGHNIHVRPADEGDVVFGAAGFDAIEGETTNVVRTGVVGLTASTAVAAGQAVEVADGGTIAPLGTGVAIGVAVDDIPQNATGPVALNI